MKVTKAKPVRSVCPECDSPNLLGGPRGGLSQNVLCPNCEREWNYTPFGFDPIIPARLHLYGIETKKEL